MLFADVIDYLEELRGIVLVPINPSTPSLVIINIDRDQERYFLRLENEQKITSRSFRELKEIWQQLELHKYVNVEQALSGVGSSRNQPETILSHFPNIEFFKYQNRKHLLLRSINTHGIGSQREVELSDQKNLKKLIDNQRSFNASLTNNQLAKNILSFQNSLQQISVRFPGEPFILDLTNAILDLRQIQREISKTIVSLDAIDIEMSLPQSFSDDKSVLKSVNLDKLADLPIFTGVEDDVDVDEEPTSDALQPIFRRQTPTLTLLYDRLHYGEIEMQPEYQRKDRIWPEKHKSKLIESILMGLPLPVFYFGEKLGGNWIVIDGLQRLSTIQDFMTDKFSLKDLEKLTNLNGKNFSNLSRTEIRKIKESEITAYVVDASVGNEESVVELFSRINTYGVQLSSQEIRNAMHLGSSVSFLRNLANSEVFKDVTNKVVSSKRQKDIELCLGSVAFILAGYKNFDAKTYDAFLRETMKRLNKERLTQLNEQDEIDFSSSKLLTELKSRFSSGLKFAKEIFGDAVFRKNINTSKTEPLSKPLFELITSLFSGLTQEQKSKIKLGRANLVTLFYEAIQNDSSKYADWNSISYSEAGRGFGYSISQSTGKKITIEYRFNAMIQIIYEATGVKVDLQAMDIGEEDA